MKSPLKKFLGFGSQKNDAKEKKGHRPRPNMDELVQATQDMQDMMGCYDSLLLAAATTINSAHEFSEALQDMGSCLLEKIALNDDEESCRVLLMLGNLQFTLHKLVDNYRAHIIQTITKPSESLLKELQTVEEMKLQCDGKRERYKSMLSAEAEKGRSKHSKRRGFSSEQLKEAQEDYEGEAALFIFRLKSLKQGKSRSLLTQASRHFSAQLNFFQKGLRSLEAAEPHVKKISVDQHIDYQFSGLEDDMEDEDVDDESSIDIDDEELSFDRDQTNLTADVISSSRNSMEVDQVERSVPPTSVNDTKQKPLDRKEAGLPRGLQNLSKSAPIFSNMSTESSKPEETPDIRPSPARKSHSYVLPTPVDAKNPASADPGNDTIPASYSAIGRGLHSQLRHTSPLEPNKHEKYFEARSSLEEGSIRSSGPVMAQFGPTNASAAKKIKAIAYSGPLLSRSRSTRIAFSGPAMPSRFAAPPSVSPSPPGAAPRISELHELPRPPVDHTRPAKPSGLVGHSAPLVSRGHECPATKAPFVSSSHTAFLLPTPTMARSVSIPFGSRRSEGTTVAGLSRGTIRPDAVYEVFSPPLSPICLANAIPISTAS